jgi:hypothetical protein
LVVQRLAAVVSCPEVYGPRQYSPLLTQTETQHQVGRVPAHGENILGVVQQLSRFDPPLDPGMLVKATAAGIDIGSIVSSLNQPLGPARAPFLMQKALEITGEVRALGNALLSALEKGDAENLALLRQGHEVALQGMVQNVRFLQWQHAQETTNGLLKARDSALERNTFYLRLLGLTANPSTVPATFALDRSELTEENFDDTYAALVGQYDQKVGLQGYPAYQPVGGSSPSNQSGASGQGLLFLNKQEDSELSTHLPTARDTRLSANVCNAVAARARQGFERFNCATCVRRRSG